MDDIRLGVIISDLNSTDSFPIPQLSAVVTAVGPILNTSNGKNVREVIVCDPHTLQAVKLRCYNEDSLNDFVPYMGVYMSDVTYQEAEIIVGKNATICQLSRHEIRADFVEECERTLRPPATSIASCTSQSKNITLSGVITQVPSISLSLISTNLRLS
jgi:hypothetical protein